MRTLKNALHALIKKNGIEKPIDQSRTLSAWQEIVGKKARENNYKIQNSNFHQKVRKNPITIRSKHRFRQWPEP